MNEAVAFGGWAAAILTAAAALVGWRTLASRMRRVAQACHEIRNPLAAARLGLHTGADGAQLSPARLRAVDLELSRAALALQDLSGLRRRGALIERFDEVEVGELLADCTEAWRGSALSRGADLRLERSGAPVYVMGDRTRLAQAIGNLIANAIEHGGRTIVLRDRVDRAGIRLEVTDDGSGLPAPVAQLRRGARSRSWRGGPPARGHGLAIAAQVLEAHGGRLASAPVQRGARLVLELPVPLTEPASDPHRKTPQG